MTRRKINLHTLALWAAMPMARTAQVESRLKMILKPNASRRALTRRAALTSLIAAALGVGTLAALRPAARAQAVPTPAAPLAQEISTQRLDFRYSSATFSRKVQAVHGGGVTISTAPDFTINGTRLLAGVCDSRRFGSLWWSGNGTPLPHPVFAVQKSQLLAVPSSKQNSVLFAFRLPPNLRGATVKYELPQSDNSVSGSGLAQAEKTEAENFSETAGTRQVAAAYPAAITQATVRIGIASGQWETSWSIDPKAGSSRDTKFGSFLCSPPLDADEQATVHIAGINVKRDIRLVAVDTQGHILSPIQTGGTNSGSLTQISARFNLPFVQVKEFRLESRPFQWAEFKNIALHPSQH